jgi:hypothetical protein
LIRVGQNETAHVKEFFAGHVGLHSVDALVDPLEIIESVAAASLAGKDVVDAGIHARD